MIEKWTPERRRALTRDALIDAASHVFAHKGYDAASLDEIAATAGFTKGAVYSNFKSKEDLLLAVVERHLDRLFAAYDRFIEGGNTAATTDVGDVVDVWVEMADRDRELNLLSLELQLLGLRNPKLRRRIAAMQRAYDARVVESGVPDRRLAVLSNAVSWNLWLNRIIDAEHADEYVDAFRLWIEIMVQRLGEDDG